MINVQLTISGQVQGVGFRWGTLQLAKQLGITGFVRNQADGTVYVEAGLVVPLSMYQKGSR